MARRKYLINILIVIYGLINAINSANGEFCFIGKLNRSHCLSSRVRKLSIVSEPEEHFFDTDHDE